MIVSGGTRSVLSCALTTLRLQYHYSYTQKGASYLPISKTLVPFLKTTSFTTNYSTTSPSTSPSPTTTITGQRLSNKVAIVTGASSSLGRAIALAIASEGARLVVCADLESESIPKAESMTTHEAICQRLGRGRAIFFRTDVRKPEEVEACVAEAVASGDGKLDIMVNNAGLGFENARVHELDVEMWDSIMKVNIGGAFLGCKYACAQFLKQDLDKNGHRGWIINTASGAGLEGVMGGASAYCASKAAIVNFTRAVALNYAKDKIHVNAICPGYLRTPMTHDMRSDTSTHAHMISQTPWGTIGEVEDVARAVVFLASEDAA